MAIVTGSSSTSLRALLACGALGALGACNGNDARNVALSGHLMTKPDVALAAAEDPVRRITHVMAVNVETAAPERFLSRVAPDGSFTLEVIPGHNYVLVFVDDTRIGTDMAVAVFRQGVLDSLQPTEEGAVDLGAMTVDAGVATPGISFEALIDALGLSADDAEYLGAIDDLSLRYANPDHDADGVIDMLQPGHEFLLDFHLRSNMLSAAGQPLRVSDMTDKFLPTDAVADFNLGSIYALFPRSYDATPYVNQGGWPGGLIAGATFAATEDGALAASTPISYSGLGYGDWNGFGPDYDWKGQELPGSDGVPATLAYTLGGSGHTLTFPNLITRTHASLTAEGVLVPFIRLDVGEGRYIQSLSYQWMKRAAGAWTVATASEVALVVNQNGGFAGFYRGAKDNRISFQIPVDPPSGTIPWTPEATAEQNVGDVLVLETEPNDLCSMAVSYDDKLGLRLFVGGVWANEGVAACP